jgi:hypothetical protein
MSLTVRADRGKQTLPQPRSRTQSVILLLNLLPLSACQNKLLVEYMEVQRPLLDALWEHMHQLLRPPLSQLHQNKGSQQHKATDNN